MIPLAGVASNPGLGLIQKSMSLDTKVNSIKCGFSTQARCTARGGSWLTFSFIVKPSGPVSTRHKERGVNTSRVSFRSAGPIGPRQGRSGVEMAVRTSL